MSYQITDNMAIRTGYSTNVLGDDLDNSMFRLQIVYGWNKATEDAKKLMQGH